jgi:beta-glucosidase
VNPNVVVVLSNGAPVEMPWAPRVPAIVEGYLGGQAGGSAVAEVLVGEREPGGRLAESFPVRWSDLPVSRIPLGPRQVEYWESLYVGYRWFDSAGVEPGFPFGHGLSYTSFEWTGFAVTPERAEDGDDLRIEVALTVTNTGDRPGADVVQVYVHDPESTVFRPEQELRAFAKVRLGPGESRQVTLALDGRAFAYWDVRERGWCVEPGRFEVRVAASSRDVRHRAQVDVEGAFRPVARAEPEVYRKPSAAFTRPAFAQLHGGVLPDNVPERRGGYTLDTLLADMRGSALARLVLAGLQAGARRVLDLRNDPAGARTVRATLRETNLRMLPLVTQGRVSAPVARGLLELVNGRYVRGLTRTVRAFRGEK